jgi:hypothetical protein
MLELLNVCHCFFNIRSAMVSKYLELPKRQAQDRYEIFISPLSRTAPPPSRHHEASSDDLVEIWVVRRTTPPPPLHLVSPPPPPTRLVAPPPPACLKEVSSDDAPSNSLGYNNECPHIKEVSSCELLLDFNCLV